MDKYTIWYYMKITKSKMFKEAEAEYLSLSENEQARIYQEAMTEKKIIEDLYYG